MISHHSPSRFFLVLLNVACLLLASCTVYHKGAPKSFLPIAYINTVENNTPEPEASIALQKALRKHCQNRNGLNISKNSHWHLATRIVDLKNSSLARAEVRDSKDRDRDDNAYQSVLFQIDMVVEYQLMYKGKLDRKGRVIGRGDLPLLHDRNLPLQNAIRTAANDAARQIAEQLTDNLQP